ncbi:MAG: hypothetical protein JJ895_00770 [Balneolaceae bacterium]|nr:hypothetical protein [Balneolaceae bacterium]
MKATIHKLEEGDVVYACWRGPITGEERHSFRDNIQKFCEELGTKKFIVDLRYQENTTDISDNYDFGKQLRRKMNGFTIAALYQPTGISEEFLIETVSRGGVNIKVFNKIDAAKKWILAQ